MIAPDGWDTVTVMMSDNSVTFWLFAVIVKSVKFANTLFPALGAMNMSFPLWNNQDQML